MSQPPPLSAHRKSWLQSLLLSTSLLAIAGVAAAFFQPWLSHPTPGGSALWHYAPLKDGAARLSVQYDREGKVSAWVSNNDRLMPPGAAVAAELRETQRRALGKFLQRTGEEQIDETEI